MKTTAGMSSLAAVLCATGIFVAGCSDSNTPAAPTLELMSSRAEAVTGGDALIAIRPGETGAAVRALLNGTDVSAAFKPDPTSPGRMVGLVTGLKAGVNTLVADNAGDSATLTLTNSPNAGPLFSGPHETPFVCQTATFRIYPGGPFLGASTDANCSAATRVDYVYRNTANPAAFVPLPNLQQVPADVASTTTDEGKTVPFIVRLETGTTNRAIYQTAVLHNPATSAAPNPTAPSDGWNRRLVYTFGGGCTGGWYRQGNNTGGVLDTPILARGYAMASSSLNVFGNNCGDLTSAESMAMVKERFIEAYGRPRYTIGWGCSGGSYQQHQIADNYPGLLDGILPGCSFPEVGFSTVYSITDQRLLGHYFRDVAPSTFTDAQIEAVAGILSVKTMYTSTVYEGALRIAPDTFCPAIVPVAQRYHPVTNRTGVRCSIYDHTVNVFGKDPATGFARRPLDNVGVQYGLAALNAGSITVDQFLAINEAVGGYDADARFVPARTTADLEATRQAYQTGRLTSGGGGLKDVPIIDYRAYSDDNPIGDIHLRYHSFSMRERLKKANGDADNQVMLVEDFRYGYYSSASPMLLDALKQMDQWLANIAADNSTGTAHAKVVRNKPASLQEGCNTRAATPTKVVEKQETGSGQCAAIYPAPGSPRVAAGAGIAADIVKCQLKPATTADYRVPFTGAQTTRLMAAFPGGVCDWSKTGVEQQPLRGTWLKF